MIAHPSDARWERTTGIGSPQFSGTELDAIEAFVRGGGGLIVLGETEQDKYGNNLNELLARFGLRLRNDTVQDYEHCDGAPDLDPWRAARRRARQRWRPAGRRERACFYRATTIATSNGARILARTHRSASVPGAPLIVASEHGDGRVVVLADSDLFGDDCIDEFDHRTCGSTSLLGGPASATAGIGPIRGRRDRTVGRAPRARLDAAARRDRRARAAAGARRIAAPATPTAAGRGHVDAIAGRSTRSRRESARRRVPERCRGSARVGDGGSASPTSRASLDGVPSRAGARRTAPAPGVLPDVQAERLARHVLRGA